MDSHQRGVSVLQRIEYFGLVIHVKKVVIGFFGQLGHFLRNLISSDSQLLLIGFSQLNLSQQILEDPRQQQAKVNYSSLDVLLVTESNSFYVLHHQLNCQMEAMTEKAAACCSCSKYCYSLFRYSTNGPADFLLYCCSSKKAAELRQIELDCSEIH